MPLSTLRVITKGEKPESFTGLTVAPNLVKGTYEGVPMQEPINWNSLPRAAEWLTGRTQSQWDATRLLDHLVASDSPIKKDGSIEISLLTIVKVKLPREAGFAAIERNAAPSKLKTDKHKTIVTLYGPPPGSTDAYTDGPYSPPFCCLYAGNLRDLLLYPSLIIGSLKKNQIYYGGGRSGTGTDLLWALPHPTQHVITIDECFIERDDLLSLGEQLCNPQGLTPGESDKSQSDIAREVQYWRTEDTLIAAFSQYGLDSESFRNGRVFIKNAKKLAGNPQRKEAAMFCPVKIMQGLVSRKRVGKGVAKLKIDRGWEIIEKKFANVYERYKAEDTREPF